MGSMKEAQAHESSARYLANESILISNDNQKVLFDPFFHKDFGIYQLVPANTLANIFAGKSPFDNISAIVVSHAHADHFAADDMLRYLIKYPHTKFVAPQQAVDELLALPNANKVKPQLRPINLAYNDPAKQIEVDGLIFEGVRIPHAGWPSRANIENIVFRVTLKDSENRLLTVMHMGDADADDNHYLPYKLHWQSRESDVAFPPYWFFYSMEGNYILDDLINAKQHVGVHVPVVVPKELKKTGKDYFSKPGEQRHINKH